MNLDPNLFNASVIGNTANKDPTATAINKVDR